MKLWGRSEREIIFHFQCSDLKIGMAVITGHGLQVQSSPVVKGLRGDSFYLSVLPGSAWHSMKSRCSKNSCCSALNFYNSPALFLGLCFFSETPYLLPMGSCWEILQDPFLILVVRISGILNAVACYFRRFCSNISQRFLMLCYCDKTFISL